MSTPTAAAPDGQSIFISYRRNDCQAQANGLHDGLAHRLKDARLFMDVDSIPAGVDFEQHIREAIDECDVVLVLIGDNWMESRPGSSVRRIDEPNDFVRLEIESALENSQVRTIPVLVEGARMPDASQLPESIQRLARINAFELDDRRWKADLERITQLLEGLHPQRQAPAQPEPIPPVAQPQPTQPLAPQPPSAAPSYGQPSTPVYSAPPRPQATQNRAWAPGHTGWQAPPAPPASRSNDAKVGWICAFLPLLCCGLLNIVPLLRSGLIRPAQRWSLIGTGIGLEVMAIVGFAIFGSAPEGADGTPTGSASGIGMALILLSMVSAVVFGIVFRNPAEPERH